MSKYKGAWPPPVYVGTFANGEVGRASFASPYGKPLDFEAGRRMVKHLYRLWWQPVMSERTVGYPPTKMMMATYSSIADSIDRYHTMPPRSDLVSGYVEFDGQQFPDPMTNAKPARAASQVEKLIASINKLSPADRKAVITAFAEAW